VAIAPPAITVSDVVEIPQEELLSALRGVRLRDSEVQPYANARLRIARVDPEALSPAQNYVLEEGVARVHALRTALAGHGVDPFELHGGLWLGVAGLPDRIPLLPPVVEQSTEADGRAHLLVSDGLHRVFAARQAAEKINVVLVEGVDEQWPYYAYPVEGGWSGVEVLAELPEVRQKKEYRWPSNYKALFRDYNALFPGVQVQRRSSNPKTLRA
jgi:hypothetical protein